MAEKQDLTLANVALRRSNATLHSASQPLLSYRAPVCNCSRNTPILSTIKLKTCQTFGCVDWGPKALEMHVHAANPSATGKAAPVMQCLPVPLEVEVVGKEGGTHEDGLVVRAGTRRESHKEVTGTCPPCPADHSVAPCYLSMQCHQRGLSSLKPCCASRKLP